MTVFLIEFKQPDPGTLEKCNLIPRLFPLVQCMLSQYGLCTCKWGMFLASFPGSHPYLLSLLYCKWQKLDGGLGTRLGYRRNEVADGEVHSMNSYNDCSGFDKNLRLSLSRVGLTTTVTITSNPVVANDNHTGAIQVFVQGTDGQVNH